MFKYISVTLAGLFTILYVFGDESRRQDVSREAPSLLTFAAFSTPEVATETLVAIDAPGISEREAVQLALKAGAAARALRPEPTYDVVAAATPQFGEDSQPGANLPNYWLVSGTRVNVRQGPGTTTAVVGQLTLGTEAEVLDARDGWKQIITKDGAIAGWISGQFLSENLPG